MRVEPSERSAAGEPTRITGRNPRDSFYYYYYYSNTNNIAIYYTMSSEYLRSNPLAEHNSGIALSSKELPLHGGGTGNMYPGQGGRAFVQGGGGMSQFYSSDVGNPENAYANGSYAPVTVGYNSVTRGGRRRGSGSKRKLRRIRRTKRKVARYSRRRNKKNLIPVPQMTGGGGGTAGNPPASPPPAHSSMQDTSLEEVVFDIDERDVTPSPGSLGLDFDLRSPAAPPAADVGGISSRLGNLQLQSNPAGGCNCDCGANSAASAAEAAAASARAAAAAAVSARAAVLPPELDEANLPAEFHDPISLDCVDCGYPMVLGTPEFEGRVDVPPYGSRCGDCARADAGAGAGAALPTELEEFAFTCVDCGYPIMINSPQFEGRVDVPYGSRCGDCARADAGAAGAGAGASDDSMGEEDEVAFVCDDCGQDVITGSREHGGRRTFGDNTYCGDCARFHLDEESDGMSNNSSSDGDGMYGGSISSKKNTRSIHSKNKRKNLKSRLTKKLKMKGANNRKKRRTLRKK